MLQFLSPQFFFPLQNFGDLPDPATNVVLTPIGQTASVTALFRFLGNGSLASDLAAPVAPEMSGRGKGALPVALQEGVDVHRAQVPLPPRPRAGPAIPWLS